MAIVDLGNLPLVIGQLPAVFNPINFRDRDAYILFASFNTDNFDNVFSFVRVRWFIEVTGQPGYFDSRMIDLDILDTPQCLFFAASELYDGNGTMTPFAERRSFYVAGDDGVSVNMNLTWEDSVNVRTWF